MPTIVAAAESQVQIGKTTVEGVRSIEYRTLQNHSPIYALGSTERIGTVAGPLQVEGRVRVASTSDVLAEKASGEAFDLLFTAPVRPGGKNVTITFHECQLSERGFSLGVGEFGEAVYAFTATRVEEKIS